MKIRNSLMALAMMATFAGSTAIGTTTIASAQEQTMTLYQGAQINARLRQPIDTGSAHVGDRFVMDVVPPYPSGNPAFQGAIISGELTSVTHAGQGRKPALGMQFDYLRLADGSTVDISATMTQDQKQQQQGNGAKVALSTIGGMLLGNVIGKSVFHTGGGGIVGAAGGLLYGLNEKTNFTLPAGSDVQLTLNQTVTIRRQAGTGQ